MKKPVTVKKNTKYERTLLAKWMDERGLTIGNVAKMVGVDRSSVQAWRVGSGLPSLPAAFRLEEVTQAAIPASSWLATTLGQHAYFTMKGRTDGTPQEG